ncbi:MAG TPA: hypothetical protein VIM73_11415 [Polyangiaceae bacterium]
MAKVNFTPNLERHLGVRSVEVQATTLRQAFDAAFAQVQGARSYVLDDQGAVRHHVAVFVDGVLVHDRTQLAYPLEPSSEIWIMQALSGG